MIRARNKALALLILTALEDLVENVEHLRGEFKGDGGPWELSSEKFAKGVCKFLDYQRTDYLSACRCIGVSTASKQVRGFMTDYLGCLQELGSVIDILAEGKPKQDWSTIPSVCPDIENVFSGVTKSIKGQIKAVKKYIVPPKRKIAKSKEMKGFIGSSKEAIKIAKLVQLVLSREDNIKPFTWSLAFRPSRNWLDELVNTAKNADFGVFVFAPDDVLKIRGATKQATRDNVIFEMGMFIGALGKEKVFFMLPDGEDLQIPSDLLGTGAIFYDFEPFKNKGRTNAEKQARLQAIEAACTEIADAVL